MSNLPTNFRRNKTTYRKNSNVESRLEQSILLSVSQRFNKQNSRPFHKEKQSKQQSKRIVSTYKKNGFFLSKVQVETQSSDQTTERYFTEELVFSGFELRIENLMIWVEGPKNKKTKEVQKKVISKGITFKIREGSMNAILGPSGSGKTTLMNYLAGRQENSQNFKTFCRYYLSNTRVEDMSEFKNLIGYVLQEDLMDFNKTPRELFEYYATLRGHPNPAESAEIIINQMKIKKCADTIVGDNYRRGLSGGEKKRVSVGIELISNPNLLFLDEPTTGLDSSTALDIITELKQLTKSGMTLITTIHSPSDDILEQFDNLIILCEGNLVFEGSPKKIIKRIKALNYQLPNFEPPLEYFMKIIDKDYLRIQFEQEDKPLGENDKNLNEEFQEKLKKIVDFQKKKTIKQFSQRPPTQRAEVGLKELRKLKDDKNQMLPQTQQFMILFNDKIKSFFSNIRQLILKIGLALVLSFIIFLTFYDLEPPEKNPYQAIQNRTGFIFILAVATLFAGANLSSTTIQPLKLVFLKDSHSKLYHPAMFYFSSILYLIPFFLVVFGVTSLLFFFGNRLNTYPSLIKNLTWFELFSVFNGLLSGMALGSVLGVVMPDLKSINTAQGLFAMPLVLLSGSFVTIRSLIWPLFLLSYMSPVRFVFQGLALNEFQNRHVYIENCKLPPFLTNLCDPLRYHNFYEKEIWINFIICFVLIIWGFYIVGFVIFMVMFRERKTNYAFDEEVYITYRKI